MSSNTADRASYPYQVATGDLEGAGVVFNIISLVLSFAAVVVAVLVALRQAKAARNSDSLLAMLQLFDEYRKDDLKKARGIVFRLPDSVIQSGRMRDLPRESRIAAERVAHYFDHVALLMAFDLIPVEPMVAFFGLGCHQLWLKLAPLIDAERQTRDDDQYLAYFEAFAALYSRHEEQTINAAAFARLVKR
jgi:hypothetical protein